MATFNYVRLGSRVGVIQNGRTNRRWFSPEDIKPVKDTERGVMILEALNNGSYSATINPATDTVVLDGTTIAAGGTLDALETALVGSSVFLKPSSGGGGGSFATITGQPTDNANLASALAGKANLTQLNLNARAGLIGTSLTAEAIGYGTNQSTYQSQGVWMWVALLTNGFFYLNPNANKAVTGAIGTNIRGGMDALFNQNLDFVYGDIGTNNLGDSLADITAQVSDLYDATLASTKLSVFITIPPRFGANVLPAPNETKRQQVNAYSKTRAVSNKLIIIDSDAYVVEAWLRDGLHFTPTGAYNFATIIATEINKYLPSPSYRISDILSNTVSFNTNNYFLGTSGIKQNGATGNVANNYVLNGDTISGTVVGSIVTVDGKPVQQIALGGSYTGNNKEVKFVVEVNTALLAQGDIVEGIADFKIITNDVNVLGIKVDSTVFTAGYATLARTASGNTTSYPEANQLTVNTLYTTRSPSIKVATGTPGVVNTQVVIMLKNQAGATPINFVLQVSRVGTRKVNFVD